MTKETVTITISRLDAGHVRTALGTDYFYHKDGERPALADWSWEIREKFDQAIKEHDRDAAFPQAFCMECGTVEPCEHTMKSTPTREEIIG